jgi:hypothetical protein
MVDEEFLEDYVIPVRSGNPNRQAGSRFASAESGEKKETRIPKNIRSESGIKTAKKGLTEKGYSFFGGKNQPIYVRHNGETISNEPFNSIEEAVKAANEHYQHNQRGEEIHSPTENIGGAVKELGGMLKKSGEKSSAEKTSPEFKAGKHVFSTHQEAKQHIRMQRRKWRWARPVRTPAAYVAKRGFGFTHAKVPGFRKLVSPPKYTISHDEEMIWEIVFDEFSDILPLTDADLSEVEVEDYNMNPHDPHTGEFTSGTIGPALPGQESVKQLAEKSKNEAAMSTFSSSEKAREHINKQLEAWNRHHATQLEALAEIKRQQAKWKKAKVFVHTKKAPGLFGAKTHHFTVGTDSIPEIELTETDLIAARQRDEILEIDERVSVPVTD